MHVVARGRHWLARHPSAYWLAVVVLAAVIGSGVAAQVSALDDARRSWGTARPVLIARADLAPGTSLDGDLLDTVALPETAVPPSALTSLPHGGRLRQRVAAGEVLVAADVTGLPGPAARAPHGTVVVTMRTSGGHGTASRPLIGLTVQIVADGLLLADGATIVEVDGDAVFVAVAVTDGPAVAAAERAGIASLLYLPM